MERVAFCSTGSEAVMAAIRVARTVSGRDKIVMFDRRVPRDLRRSAGPADESATAARGPFPLLRHSVRDDRQHPRPRVRDAGDARRHQVAEPRQLAAVLVEPVQSRRPELAAASTSCTSCARSRSSEIALVFDEVVTGFRVHPGGAQALFGVRADHRDVRQGRRWRPADRLVAGQREVPRCARRRHLELRRRLAAGGRRDVLRRHLRPPSASTRCRTGGAAAKLKEEGPELQRTLNMRTTRSSRARRSHR